MTDFNLIDYAVPKGGVYCVVGMKDKQVTPFFTEDRETLDGHIDDLVQGNHNVFITLGRLQAGSTRRLADNIECFSSIWVDIDCGEEKAKPNATSGLPDGYPDKETANQALIDFCELVELPDPAIIDSGNGIHAYWGFTEDVPKNKWLALANRLKKLCATQEFYADPNVYDAARIMRLPETYNHKSNPPKKASVKVGTTERYDFDELCSLLGVTEEEEEEAASAGKSGSTSKRPVMDALDKFEALNRDFSFKRIVTREDGCKQLQDSIRNRSTLIEPRWFDALSIAKFCSDRDKAVHTLSEGHPDYDPDETERKVTPIKSPHTCARFEINNPGGCKECEHFNSKSKKKIKTPYSLGKVVHEDSATSIYPEPYFRGKNGGLYRRGADDEDPVFIYPYDFCLVDRMINPEKEHIAVFKSSTPHDGESEILIPNELLEQRAFLKHVGTYGIVPGKKGAELWGYAVYAVQTLLNERKAKKMRVQFGWADNDTKFIVGEQEITVDAVYHSPASPATKGYAPHLKPKGSLEMWQDVFNLYNRKGLEVQAFAALSGFGAPLLKMTGQKGAIINLIHNGAGTGKTTVLRMANSVCGDPEELLGKHDDSVPGRTNKLGYLNNIVNTMDELTNMTGDQVSSYAYACSQGKGREKATQTANINRVNNTTWRTITLSTSNASFYQKLMSAKAQADGEMMRIIEFNVDYPSKEIVGTEYGKAMFDHQLNENYGHAIVPFVQYIIANPDFVQRRLLAIQAKIDKELQLTQRERNWSAIIAANLTGGWLANKLGLIKFDMERIYQKCTPVILELRRSTAAPVDAATAVIYDFLTTHINNTLAIRSDADMRSHARINRAALAPRGPLHIRLETDTKRVFIKRSALRDHFTDNQTDFNDNIKELDNLGILIHKGKNVRLGKGYPIPSGLERCVILDGNHPDFIQPDFSEQEDEDGSGEGGVPDKLEEV